MFNRYPYALNPSEKTQIKTLREKGIQPTIVALYDSSHGTTYADKAIAHFSSKGINVVKISPAEGLSHPIFTSNDFNGIYLPGGHNISPEETRTNFEVQLLELAEQKDLPLIGICRGLQIFGYHSGGEVKDLPENITHATDLRDVGTNSANPVVIQPGSQLYNALQYKFKNADNKPFEYFVTCLHDQNLVGNLENGLKVTGRNHSDGVIEAVERSTGKYTSFALQHHPEAVIDLYKRPEALETAVDIIGYHVTYKLELVRRDQLLAEKMSSDIQQLETEHEKLTKNTPEYFLSSTRLADEKMRLAQITNRIKEDEASIAFYQQKKRGIEEYLANPERSKEEIAARAELGLFTKQVKKQFLEQQVQPKETGCSKKDPCKR